MGRCVKCMERIAPNMTECPNCHTKINLQADNNGHYLKSNTLLSGKYTIIKVKGENSLTVKYLAFDEINESKAYIYEYFPDKLVVRDSETNFIKFKTAEKANIFEKALGGYINEIEKIMSLSAYNGIENIYDYFIENNTCYAVCEYKSYTALSSYLKKNKYISIEKARRLIDDLWRTIDVLHKNDIVHGSISPEHIVVLNNDKLMLVDYGMAGYINVTGLAVYNPVYSPYELRGADNKARADKRSDVFSAAALSYRILTGLKPFGIEERINGKAVIAPKKLGIDVSKGFENAILNGMNIIPANRYKSAKEMLIAMRSKKNVRIKEKNLSYMQMNGRGSFRNGAGAVDARMKIAAAAAAAALIAVILVFIVLTSGRDDAQTAVLPMETAEFNIDEQYMQSNENAFLENGDVYIPLGSVFKEIGFEYVNNEWHKDGSVITLKYDGGQMSAACNGEEWEEKYMFIKKDIVFVSSDFLEYLKYLSFIYKYSETDGRILIEYYDEDSNKAEEENRQEEDLQQNKSETAATQSAVGIES